MYDKLFRPFVQHEGFILYVIFGSVALLMLVYAIWCARWVYRDDRGKKPAKGKKGKKKKAPAKKKPAEFSDTPAESTDIVKRDDANASETTAADES